MVQQRKRPIDALNSDKEAESTATSAHSPLQREADSQRQRERDSQRQREADSQLQRELEMPNITDHPSTQRRDLNRGIGAVRDTCMRFWRKCGQLRTPIWDGIWNAWMQVSWVCEQLKKPVWCVMKAIWLLLAPVFGMAFYLGILVSVFGIIIYLLSPNLFHLLLNLAVTSCHWGYSIVSFVVDSTAKVPENISTALGARSLWGTWP
jgi:hypothetical protein